MKTYFMWDPNRVGSLRSETHPIHPHAYTMTCSILLKLHFEKRFNWPTSCKHALFRLVESAVENARHGNPCLKYQIVILRNGFILKLILMIMLAAWRNCHSEIWDLGIHQLSSKHATTWNGLNYWKTWASMISTVTLHPSRSFQLRIQACQLPSSLIWRSYSCKMQLLKSIVQYLEVISRI